MIQCNYMGVINIKILNFGSCNIDFVYRVEHIVKSGETIAASSVNRYHGGKGLNQSIAAAKAGMSRIAFVKYDSEKCIEEIKKLGVKNMFDDMRLVKSFLIENFLK